jgi:[lysine-biosynthesis-protein LysW]---L-2-aminoadipate ligase
MTHTLRAGILCSRLRVEERLLRDALVRRGVDVDLVDDRTVVFDVSRPLRAWDVVVERSLSQTRGIAALRVLASWDVPVVNTPEVAELCANKLSTTAALRAAGLPIPRTLVAFSAESAVQAAETIGYPVVLKPVTGSWGRLVARINDRDAAEALFEHKAVLGSPDHAIYYVQEHVDKPGRDIRAFVVGDVVVCAVYRTSDHWITNTARGATTANCALTHSLVSLCRRAAAAIGGGVLAVDLLERDDELLISEVNATMEFRNSIDVTGVDIAGHVADFVVTAARAATTHRVA